MLNFKDFFSNYKTRLNSLLDTIKIDEIDSFIKALKQASINKNKIYIIGNGGSASTASHMANDLRAGLGRRDIIQLDAISLCDNVAVISALANDVGYENIFYYQLKDILTKNDIVVAISCSGNSKNIIKAVEYTKQVGATVVGFTGFNGGRLKQISDIKIHIDSSKDEFGVTEDLHLFINHIIYEYLKEEI